jgi:hypothetical protein
MPEVAPVLLAVDGNEAVIMRDFQNTRLKDLQDADHMWQISVENGQVIVRTFEIRCGTGDISEFP